MPHLPLTRRRQFLVRCGILVVLAALAGFAMFLVKEYSPAEYSFFPQCTMYRFTGLHCPGCGLTRATHSMLNGDLRQALAYNLFAPVVVPFLAFMIVKSIWRSMWGTSQTVLEPQALLKGESTKKSFWKANRVPMGILVVMLLFWVARNIPEYPFNLLAPHELNQ